MFDTSEGITQIYHPENSPEEIRSSVDDSGKKEEKFREIIFWKRLIHIFVFILKVPRGVEELEQVVKMTDDLQ